MNVAEVLRAAADRIDRDGLHKGDHFPSIGWESWARTPADGPCCVMGALGSVTGKDPYGFRTTTTSSRAAGYLALYLQRTRRNQDLTVPGWNDAKGVRKSDVVKTLRKAADEWDKENNK